MSRTSIEPANEEGPAPYCGAHTGFPQYRAVVGDRPNGPTVTPSRGMFRYIIGYRPTRGARTFGAPIEIDACPMLWFASGGDPSGRLRPVRDGAWACYTSAAAIVGTFFK